MQLALGLASLLVLTSCTRAATVPFSERPELREEVVLGCGGGGLRYLVPSRAAVALRAAARGELVDEPPHDLESARVPCELCDELGGVCGSVVARFRETHEGRTGLRVHFRSTVASSNTAASWRTTKSERLVDQARIAGVMTYADGLRVLDWVDAHLDLERPVHSLASRDVLFEPGLPDEVAFRVAELVRADEGAVLYRHIYLRVVEKGFVVAGERRHSEEVRH